MNLGPQSLRATVRSIAFANSSSVRVRDQLCLRCQRAFQRHNQKQPFHTSRPKAASNPADDPNFTSILDNPPQLVKTGKRHGPGLVILALIPITAFALGTWQVQRLSWKTDLIARYEDRLLRPPLPLPPRVDPSAIAEFDYRRVEATGHFRHDLEMLVGPRLHDGADGFTVITPLEREGGDMILVNRGWIPREMEEQAVRQKMGGSEALPRGLITLQGLLREPLKGNMFTPANKPREGKWYFPAIPEMAATAGAAEVYVEEVMDMELLEAYRREEKGVPIGRAAEVNLRNNHAQYVFTWYTLGIATSVMLYLVLKKPPRGGSGRVRRNNQW